ncbi:MAG: hypothetical protein IKR48_10190 [Kiritimatiellae bacterium]|nr:hypothetical protein [Kiritimatiellia bacterium]
MKTVLTIIGVAAVVAAVWFFAVSGERRHDMLTRIDQAVQGNDTLTETPKIVAEQQRRERIRQNTSWTAENRALHPIEYCQAQLEELTVHARRLEASAHEVATKQSEVRRTMGDNEAMVTNLAKFLDEAKKAYRACEASNSWPVVLGGYSLTKEKAQDKIIEASQRLSPLRSRLATQKNQLVHLEKKASAISNEQRRLENLRERVQSTISDLKVKTVIDGNSSVADSLNAIHDAMGSLGVDFDAPKVEDVLAPGAELSREAMFEKIMAE